MVWITQIDRSNVENKVFHRFKSFPQKFSTDFLGYPQEKSPIFRESIRISIGSSDPDESGISTAPPSYPQAFPQLEQFLSSFPQIKHFSTGFSTGTLSFPQSFPQFQGSFRFLVRIWIRKKSPKRRKFSTGLFHILQGQNQDYSTSRWIGPVLLGEAPDNAMPELSKAWR